MDASRVGTVVLLVSAPAIFALAPTHVARQVRAGRTLRGAEVG